MAPTPKRLASRFPDIVRRYVFTPGLAPRRADDSPTPKKTPAPASTPVSERSKHLFAAVVEKAQSAAKASASKLEASASKASASASAAKTAAGVGMFNALQSVVGYKESPRGAIASAEKSPKTPKSSKGKEKAEEKVAEKAEEKVAAKVEAKAAEKAVEKAPTQAKSILGALKTMVGAAEPTPFKAATAAAEAKKRKTTAASKKKASEPEPEAVPTRRTSRRAADDEGDDYIDGQGV